MSSDDPFVVNGENAATINDQMSCLILSLCRKSVVTSMMISWVTNLEWFDWTDSRQPSNRPKMSDLDAILQHLFKLLQESGGPFPGVQLYQSRLFLPVMSLSSMQY